VVGPACVGLFLGWQAGAAVCGAVLALHLVVRLLGGRSGTVDRMSPGVFLLAASLAWILAWEPIARFWG
jgi:hypothetical protein